MGTLYRTPRDQGTFFEQSCQKSAAYQINDNDTDGVTLAFAKLALKYQRRLRYLI